MHTTRDLQLFATFYIRGIKHVLMKVLPVPRLIRRGEKEGSRIFANFRKSGKKDEASEDNFHFLRGTLPPSTLFFGNSLDSRVGSKLHRFGDTFASYNGYQINSDTGYGATLLIQTILVSYPHYKV